MRLSVSPVHFVPGARRLVRTGNGVCSPCAKLRTPISMANTSERGEPEVRDYHLDIQRQVPGRRYKTLHVCVPAASWFVTGSRMCEVGTFRPHAATSSTDA
eukprot:438312-Rhodomonas_salina.1